MRSPFTPTLTKPGVEWAQAIWRGVCLLT